MSWDIDQVKRELRGPAALVMAPFNEGDLSLNVEALKENIRFMLNNGMKTGKGYVICPCGTGEYVSLSPEEHQIMVETALEVTGGNLPVVAGVADLDLNEVIAMTKNAQRAGARYVMVSPPTYYEIDQDGMYEWYRILNESVDVGIMIYDQSWRGDLGTRLGLPLIERLAGLDNIISLKYGSPHIFEDMITALERFSDRFAFVDNSLGFTSVVAHMHGGTSFISGPATWWPEFELKFFQMMEEGMYAEADRWHARLIPYMNLFHGEYWTAPRYFHHAAIVKASLEYVGLYGGPLRPPFRAMDQAAKNELFAIMDQVGVQKSKESMEM